MSFGFVEFSAIFIALNILTDFIHYKVHAFRGIDFLFFAPWLASAIYGFYQGLILAVVLLVMHIPFNLHIALYQVASFPAQAIAVFLGSIMGIGGFWISMAAFFIVSSAIVIALRGFGGRFLIFLLTALVFNYFLFFTIPIFLRIFILTKQ